VGRDWSFARQPLWIISHVFAGTLIVGFIFAGLWQLNRLNERRAENAIILERADATPQTLADALRRDEDQLDYVAVADEGLYLDGELIRVANRSLHGLGGDWVVGLFETSDGRQILVNRGFSTRDASATEPPGPGPITGWLRETRVKDSFLGAVDTGEGARVPRLDVALLVERFDLDPNMAPVWLQLHDPEAVGVPEPVPLPPIDERHHFSYAMQWFTFAILSLLIYVLMLRKKAGDMSGRSAPGDDTADDERITSEVARAH
jgi:surfeit locus 1 family protein